MVDDSENVNRAVRLLRETADVLAQTNINVDTSSSQSTSFITPNTRPSSNDRDRDELAAGLCEDLLITKITRRGTTRPRQTRCRTVRTC